MTVSTNEDEQALTQEQEVARGRRAEALLRDPLIVEAFEELDRAFYRAFREIAPTDHQGLAHLRLLIKCLDEFKGFFTLLVQTGQLTKTQIEEVLKHDEVMERLERQRLTR